MLLGNIAGMDLCGVKHLPDAACALSGLQICKTRRPDKQRASGNSEHKQ